MAEAGGLPPRSSLRNGVAYGTPIQYHSFSSITVVFIDRHVIIDVHSNIDSDVDIAMKLENLGQHHLRRLVLDREAGAALCQIIHITLNHFVLMYLRNHFNIFK